MISVETTNPVYSNAGGKTKEQKAESRARAWEKAKTMYRSAKDSGILQGVENLALQGKGSPTGNTFDAELPPPPPLETKKPMSLGLKIGIGVGVLALGFAVYWFAIRKK